jgi:TatA/E family protein of Tat protein translocase
MGPIGFPELLIILVVALIVFGPRKLPELGRSLGKSLSEFKRASNELRSTLEDEIRIDEHKARTQASQSPGVAEPAAASASKDLTPAPETVARGEQGS